MAGTLCDAPDVFAATGDFACNQIRPALPGLVRDEALIGAERPRHNTATVTEAFT